MLSDDDDGFTAEELAALDAAEEQAVATVEKKRPLSTEDSLATPSKSSRGSINLEATLQSFFGFNSKKAFAVIISIFLSLCVRFYISRINASNVLFENCLRMHTSSKPFEEGSLTWLRLCLSTKRTPPCSGPRGLVNLCATNSQASTSGA